MAREFCVTDPQGPSLSKTMMKFAQTTPSRILDQWVTSLRRSTRSGT